MHPLRTQTLPFHAAEALVPVRLADHGCDIKTKSILQTHSSGLKGLGELQMNTQQISLEQENFFNAGIAVNRITRLFRRSAVSLAALLLVALELTPASAFSATFYVDPATGNDTNAGSSQSAPWKSVPGMTGASSWGSFGTGNKVPAGTVIEIKAGATFAGKRWLVDSTYYQSGTAASPITIRVSPSWGSGNVVIDGQGASVPTWNGGIQVTNMNYIIMTGVDASRRLEIKNYSAHAGIMHYNSGGGSTRGTGNQLKWFDCHNSSTYCIANVWQDSLLYEDGIAHDNGTGIVMGDVDDATGNNNILRRVISYNNGKGASKNDGSVSFGFQITGGVNTIFDTCEAYGNGRDGFDGGRADNAGNASITFINSYSHDNGEDGFGLNSGPTGNVTAIHINTVAARNSQANWTVYDGAHIEIYHSAGRASSANFHAFSSYSGWPKPTIKLRNSYFSTSGSVQIQYYNPGPNGYPAFDSNYNLWVPGSANSENVDNATAATYTSPPSWKGANDKFGAAYTQAFVSIATDNYRLADNTGPANNVGTYLTAPAGVNVDRNGVARSNPPDIGPFGSGTSSGSLAAPTNLRVL